MNILSQWIRSYVPGLTLPDRELAEALTLRGIAVEGIFELGPGNGSLFEMDITTNRVDAMNHYGIAREAAAIAGHQPWRLSTSRCRRRNHVTVPIKVSIEAPELCGRFTARALSQVRIQPSTGVVAERFALLQQKLISNAVDATNYVTLAMGHPTHAFDRDKLEGGIIVRRARSGEKLRTLDGIERVLDPEDLVVADEKKALGLAGVMGGWDTMITAETKNILVEAAWFDPATVRRSSKRHGLHTDASHRFERGADFNAPPVASALGQPAHPRSRRPRRRGDGRRGRSRSRRADRTAPSHRAQPSRGAAHSGRNRRRPRRGAGYDRVRTAGSGLQLAQGRGRRLPGDSAQLAPGSRTRDRPDRRDRSRLWLQPLRQYASRLLRHGERTAGRPQRGGRSPDAARAWAGTRLYPALSALLPKRLHLRRSRALP